MRTISRGSVGSTVELLQLALRRAGLLDETPDGIFGPRTEAAVLAFQQRSDLEADGIVGPKTWVALHPYMTGFRVVQVKPGVTVKEPLPFAVVPTDISWSSDLLALVIDGLCARYPFLRVETLGFSVMGRPIFQLSIGTGSRRVGYNAAHHANEWITTPVLLKFLEQCAAGIVRGGSIGGLEYRHLFDTYTLDVVPMVNPDGVDMVTCALDENSPYYKEAERIAADFPEIAFPTGWKANIEGIDTNLSYPARWEEARRIKFAQGFTKPAPRDYVGPAPLSAPESAAMHKRALEADYRLVLAYHTQGRLIFWKFADYNPPGAYELALRMQAVSGYLPSVPPPGSANAGYKDWFIQQFNRPGYTIEVGMGTNPLPLWQFGRIYRENVGILLLGMIGS